MSQAPRCAPLVLSLVVAGVMTCAPVSERTEGHRPPADPAAAQKKAEAAEKRRLAIEAERKSLAQWIDAAATWNIAPSVAAVVVHGDQVSFRHLVRTDPKMQFQVASLTKTFVALSILQLAAKGRLSLDDPVSKYLHVSFENEALGSAPITIRHLLTHTGGLLEEPNPKFNGRDVPFVVPQQVYPAGYQFSYCNQGYNLLGYIVFEAGGMPLGEYITRNILQPLGMNNSSAPEGTRGAAGVTCSLDDLVIYLRMMLGRGTYNGVRIVPRRLFDEMARESVEEPPSRHKEYRGICWRMWTIDGAVYSMHHAAHMDGAGGFMQVFPRHQVGYVFISNPPVYDREEYYQFYNGMKYRLIQYSQVLMEDGFKPLAFMPDRPTVKDMERFAGRYRLGTDKTKYVDVAIHPSGQILLTRSFAPGPIAAAPTSMHTFVYIYPGQSERGEIFDFVIRKKRLVGMGTKEGFFERE